MKLKIVPIVLAVVGSASILFGGWFVYHSVAMENPLNQALNGTPGVVGYEARIEGDKAVFQVELEKNANLREIVQEIEKKNAQVTGKRQTVIEVASDTTPALEEWWSKALFGVAQAMETRQYADIPAGLEELAENLPGLAVTTEMDQTNVYVRLTEGEHAKFIVLPRNSATLGVWTNE